MAPQQHLDWLEDNIAWFEDLAIENLDTVVPSCPGWSVGDVLNHLSFGLGLGYPVALSKAPNTDAVEAFEGVDWPDAHPTGRAIQTTFSINLRRCLAIFSRTDPETPCWTYEGPGVAKFWFRRAAIETTLHRMDVEDALDGSYSEVPTERLADAVHETVQFALPLAAAMSAQPQGTVTVVSPNLDLSISLGEGQRQATISGGGQETLLALWGRNRNNVVVSGDHAVAAEWLAVIETAFAGR